MQEKIEDVKEMEISPDEAEKLDQLDNKYFKPETNIEYKMSFKSWKLIRKAVPDFNEKTKMVEKTVLCLVLDSLNGTYTKPDGTPVEVSWEILSQKCRIAWDAYYRNGNIVRKIFSYKQKGDNKDRTYIISEVGDKPGVKPQPAPGFTSIVPGPTPPK